MSKFELDTYQIEEEIVQIITGKKIFGDDYGNIYAVCFPKISVRDSARLIYLQTVKKLQIKGLPTRLEMRQRIKSMGLLPKDFDLQIAQIEASLESLRKAREMTNSRHQLAELDLELEKEKKKLLELKLQELNLMVHTCESKAEEAQQEYMVANCTLTGLELDERLWKDYKEFQECKNTELVRLAKRNFSSLMGGLDPSNIRALARSGDWRRRWKASKQTGSPVFEGSSADWDRNKVEICYWSDFYDSIFSYHTPPPEDIINDDEKLFEWIREVNRLNATGGEATKTQQQGGTVKRVNTPYKVRTKKK